MRRAGAALVRNYLPSSALLEALESADFGQLDQRLRDRIELERLRNETEKDRAELKDLAARLASHAEQPAPDDLDPMPLLRLPEKPRKRRGRLRHTLIR